MSDRQSLPPRELARREVGPERKDIKINQVIRVGISVTNYALRVPDSVCGKTEWGGWAMQRSGWEGAGNLQILKKTQKPPVLAPEGGREGEA